MPRRVRDKIALLFAINEVVLILILCSIRSARYYGNTALYQDVFTSYLCLTKFAQRGEPPQAVAKPPVSAKQARTLTRSHFALPLTSYLLPLTSYPTSTPAASDTSSAIAAHSQSSLSFAIAAKKRSCTKPAKGMGILQSCAVCKARVTSL